MRLRIINENSRKIWKVDANARKTQLFRKICPKFSKRSLVAGGPGATYPHLQPAVNRQPGYRRGNFFSLSVFLGRFCFLPWSSAVSPAVTRLTVYRRLQVRIGRAWTPDNYGTIRNFRADFLKKLSFYTISIHFLDFIHLRMINVDPHAQGFAPL